MLHIGLQQGNSPNSMEHLADEISGPLSPVPVPAHKQIKYTAGIANGSIKGSASFMDQTRKVNFLLLQFKEFGCLPSSSSKWVSVVADGAHWAVVNEKVSSSRTIWKAMEMEEESSSVAVTIQMEMAEAVETLRMD